MRRLLGSATQRRRQARPPAVRAGRALLAALAVFAVACQADGGGPRPSALVPDRGPATVPVAVVILGGGFEARVATDFSDSDRSGVDARFQAFLGTTALEDVSLRADGSLAATVPAGLAEGTYDLAVVDPRGRTGHLPQAYRVQSLGPPSGLVASFRIEPLGAQEARRPFAVTVTALDAAGQPVPGFTGAVTLSDLTGTAVPGSVGRFSAGRWTGKVEIRAPHASDVLSAGDGFGATGASAPFAVAPATAAAVAFQTGPHATTAGACTGPVSLALVDAFGVPTTAAGPTPLTLSPNPTAGFSAFADPTCGTPLGTPLVATGQGAVGAWFVATRSGSLELGAWGSSLASSTQVEAVAPGPPAALAFVSAPQSVSAGACSAEATVEVRDAFGNPSTEGLAPVLLEASPAGRLDFYADPACAVPASTLVVAAGAARAALWFGGTVAGPVQVTASAAGLAQASQDALVVPADAAAALVFVTPPRLTAAGACSEQLVLEARDSFGNAVAGAGAIQVALSAAPAGGVGFFADAACSVPATAVQISPGGSTTGFHVRGTRAGEVEVTATAPTLTPASQTERLTAAAPAQVVFGTAPQDVAAGACSGAVTLQVQDAFGNAALVGAPLSIGLLAAPGAGVGFFADSGCATPVGAVTVGAGAGAAVFHFRGTVAATLTLTLVPAGLVGAEQPARILAAGATRLAFTSPPLTVAAGRCTGPVTLRAEDPLGNASPLGAGATVALTPTPAAGVDFYRDAGCTTPAATADIPAGASAGSFHLVATIPGSLTIGAVAPGLAPDSQVETVTPAPPTQLAFASAPLTVEAGRCSGPLVVESRDQFGNPSPPSATVATSVALTAAPEGLSLHAGAGCAGPPVGAVALPPGERSATFSFVATVAGPVTMTATSAPLAPAAQVETIVAAPPDHLAFATAAQRRSAGACSGVVTLVSRDRFGNPATAPATALTLSASPAAGFAFYADPACSLPLPGSQISPGAAGTDFYFAGDLAGSVTVTASAAGFLPDPAQLEIIDAGAPERLAFGTAPQTVVAGSCSSPVTVLLLDGHGNAASAPAALALALTAVPAAGLAFHAGASCDGAPATSLQVPAGAASVTFSFRATAAGTVELSASGATVGATAPQAEQVVPAPPDRVVFTTPPQSVTSRACSAPAIVEARDPSGNGSSVLAATPVALSAVPAGGVAYFSDPGCSAAIGAVTIPAGGTTASFHFKGSTGAAATTVTVTAAPVGLAAAAQDQTIAPAASPTRLAFVTAPQAVTAGACSGTLTVEAQDSAGQPTPPALADLAVALEAAPAVGVTFFEGAGCVGAPVGTLAIPVDSTRASLSFRATAAGPVAITAASAPLTPATQAQAVEPASPDRLVFATAPQVRSAGSCSGAVTLSSRDPYGNAAPVPVATTATLAAAPPVGFTFYSDAACSAPVSALTLAAGTSAADFHFRGTVAQDVVVTAAAAGYSPTPTQAEAITAGAATHLGFTTSPQAIQAGGCSAAAEVRAFDAHGNQAVVAVATAVALTAAPAGGVTFRAGPGCTGAAVGAVAIPAGASAATFWFTGTAAGTVTLGADVAGWSPAAAQTATVVPAPPARLVFQSGPQTVQAGACSAPVILAAQDVHGNASAAVAATTVNLSAAPLGDFTFYQDADCTTPAGSITLAAGAGTASFRFRGTVAQAVTVTASAPGLSPSPTQVERITASSPHHLVFPAATAPPVSGVTAGACWAGMVVQVVDAFGNATTVAAATPIGLGSTATGGFAFHAAAGCSGGSITGVTIAAGSGSAAFSFRATRMETITLSASGPGLAPDASDAFYVGPAAADHLTWQGPPTVVTAGGCSATFVLRVEDAFGNATTAPGGASMTLAASPGAGVGFYSGVGCGTPLPSPASIAGQVFATFYVNATVAGTVTITPSVPGWTTTPLAVSVSPGNPHHFVWSAIGSPQAAGVPFAVTLTAYDASGNVATGTGLAGAALSASSGSLTCTSGCTTGTTTGAFTGVWSGSVAIPSAAAGLTLAASSTLPSSAVVAGTSNAFDVQGPAPRSPPLASITASPRVVVSGGKVTFDAGGSTDYQTPAAALGVSWQLAALAPADVESATAPPTAPTWTAWSTTKTATHDFVNNTSAPVVYHPRVAVRDTEAAAGGPDVGYAATTVIVLNNADALCVVTTASFVDDGATACSAGGADGKVSLPEAVRLANAWGAGTPVITFSGPMTIAGTGALGLTHPVYLVAQPGVVLDTATLSISATGVLIQGLELARLASPITVQGSGSVTFRDVTVRDGAGITASGRVVLHRVRMAACSGTCVRVASATTGMLNVHGSEFQGAGGDVGIALDACAADPVGDKNVPTSPYRAFNWSAYVGSSVFSGFGTAIRATCGPALLANDTFAGNATGVDGVGGAYLLDAIFTGQTVRAMSPGTCAAIGKVARLILWQNASDGCSPSDLVATPASGNSFVADPLLIYPAARDYRIQYASPAKDWANATNNFELDDAGPGLHLGANPDRGGRETY